MKNNEVHEEVRVQTNKIGDLKHPACKTCNWGIKHRFSYSDISDPSASIYKKIKASFVRYFCTRINETISKKNLNTCKIGKWEPLLDKIIIPTSNAK